MPIVIETNGKKIKAENRPENYLSFILQQAGVPLDLQCSGLGICGKCEVELGKGKYVISGTEVSISKGEKKKALACQTKVLGKNAEVRIPHRALLQASGKIYSGFEVNDFNFSPLTRRVKIEVPEASLEKPSADCERFSAEIKKTLGEETFIPLNILRELHLHMKQKAPLSVTAGKFNGVWKIIDVFPSENPKPCLGLAVDIGTTTVAAALVDMADGKILSRESAYNEQMARADDVASRISAASTSPDGLRYMKDLVVNDTINQLVKALCGKNKFAPEHIYHTAVSGNTVMAHLFLGLSPEGIGQLPFSPVTNAYPDNPAKELGVLMNPEGIVSVVPSVAGYIGGDITSDIHVTDILNKNNGISVIIDLGTNSEMIVCEGGHMYAAAAAAGPAFEGAGTSCGCRAVDGAIEHISYGSTLDFNITTIGEGKPCGFCGSGIIDFAAEGFRCGLINKMGRFDLDMLKSAGKYSLMDILGRKYHACIVVPTENSASGEPIYVTEADIEQILKAKSAVYAGLKTLLAVRNKNFKDISRIFLAGGFAKYINIENAIRIGMLPELPMTVYENIGNGSLAGAWLSLVDTGAWKGFFKITGLPEVVSLNTVPEFELNFIDSLVMPNYNEDEFPGVMSEL